jgi:hypothetical protein
LIDFICPGDSSSSAVAILSQTSALSGKVFPNRGTAGIPTFSLFLSRNTLQEVVPEPQEYRRSAYSFPGTPSRKLFLKPRNTDVPPILSRIILQEAVPEAQEYRCSAYSFPATLSRKLFLKPRNTDVPPILSRNTLQEAVPETQEYRSSAYSFPGTPSRKLFLKPRKTDIPPIPFQVHSPGSCS